MQSSMSDEKKLAFVHKMAHLALSHVTKPQHFDDGGTVLGGPTTQTVNAPTKNQGLGGFISGLLGGQNNFQATAAPIQAGTNAAQLNAAYNGTQNALNSATNLNQTLTPGVAQGAGAQSALSNELASQAVGGGPNPAQAELNQNTGTNVANTAALIAGGRGVNANPGLAAMQAAGLGAQAQQQSIGQAAALRAQQTLAAQNALANLSAQQVGQGTAATGLENQVQQGEQGLLQNANAVNNAQNIQQQNALNTINSGISSANTAAGAAIGGGLLNAAGAVLSPLGSTIGKGINSLVGGTAPAAGTGTATAGAVPFAKGGKIPEHLGKMAMLYHPHYSSGGNVGMSLMGGGSVPGKPMIDHDAYKNDTVDAKLSPGEVVIDLDTLHDDGKIGKMARYVAKEIARKKSGRKV